MKTIHNSAEKIRKEILCKKEHFQAKKERFQAMINIFTKEISILEECVKIFERELACSDEELVSQHQLCAELDRFSKDRKLCDGIAKLEAELEALSNAPITDSEQRENDHIVELFERFDAAINDGDTARADAIRNELASLTNYEGVDDDTRHGE